jgi:subtilisin family serine protease
MKKLLFLLLFTTIFANAQEDAWVYFNAKANVATYLANPLTMLTQRSLDRRVAQGIALDFKDVPLDQSYIDQIAASTGITIMAKSKWLNAIHIRGTEADIRALKTTFSFIDYIDFANHNLANAARSSSQLINQNKWETEITYDYGTSGNQVEMLGIDVLHEQDFTGQGIIIAVIDAGFTNVNTITAFTNLYTNGQILGTYDYVNREVDVYTDHYHGTMVLSTIAGFVDGAIVGTAPDAQFYLFRTEDASSENPVEESYWVEAAEEADRLGVDIINTSLGYTTYDNPDYSYTYAELDGQTAFMTRGAEIAFSRGMIVVNSAGNSGAAAWHYIGVPADAPSVLAIGAVDANETITSFSSWGPSADNRIKPDVCAKGGGATVVNTAGNVVTASGTSFSGPIMSGAIASLWQAFPDKTNAELTQLIKESSHLYANPTAHEGYGIPNFSQILAVVEHSDKDFLFYPNPSTDNLNFILFKNDLELPIILLDISGRMILKQNINALDKNIDISNLAKGTYILNTPNKSFKIIKN